MTAPAKPEDLGAIWAERMAVYSSAHREIDKLVDVYFGNLPTEFNDYFTEDMHVHVVNMIRLAWDDLTTLAGKEFPIYVEPENDTATAKKRAELQEKIGYGYNRAGRVVGGIHMKMLMKVLSWWLIGTGNAVLMTLPDFEYKTPFFTFRDPRTHYPPVGWSPYTQTAADDALFAYQITVGELKRRYPAAEGEINLKLTKWVSGPGSKLNRVTMDDSEEVWVGEYYHKDSWMVATLNDQVVTLARTDDGDKGHPGVQPVRSISLYNPSSSKGRSMFADQVSIQAAMARMFSQKLDFFDRTLYPLIFHTPLAGQTIKIGAFAANEYNVTTGVQPRVDTIQPAHQIDADQTMQFAMGLSRMLNRNPESMQGAGPADSAKALAELKSGVTSSIRDGIWPPMLEALPTAYQDAARLDVALWGSKRKEARGKRGSEAFAVSYVPNTTLKGREADFEIEPGLGLAGYQGTLEMMQLYGAKMISLDTALEQGEWVRNVQEEKRRIQSDQLQDLVFADLAAKAQAGALAPGALAEIRNRVQQKGDDLFDVIEEMDKAGRMMAPPPPMMAPPGAGGIPGAPGGGPAAAMLPLPTMEALRGGPTGKRAPFGGS